MRVPGKRFFNGPVFKDFVDLKGKVAIVTGANSGIGLETTARLAEMGAKVVMACRDTEKAAAALKDIKKRGDHLDLEIISLDLGDLASVKQFTNEFTAKHKSLHILVNNAGVMRTPLWRTNQGAEIQMGVNHFGHFYLTNLLVPALSNAEGNSRVVNVSSIAHERARSLGIDDIHWEKRSYDTAEAYCRSKLANVLFSNEFNRRTNKYGIYSNSLHPGVIRTDLARYMLDSMGFVKRTALKAAYPLLWYVTKDAYHGAQTSIFCAASPSLDGVGGNYYADCKPKRMNPLALDEDLSEVLWDLSEQFVDQKFTYKE